MIKVESQQNYFIHKLGEEFIRMAKYSKALYSSQELIFDPKMKFLTTYIENNYEDPPKKYLLSKSKYEKMQTNDLDLLNGAQAEPKQK